MEKLVKHIGERERGRVYGVFGTGELTKDENFFVLELEKEWMILVPSGT